MDNPRAGFVRSLEWLRDTNQWSIAEMARRAGIPKRSMENYFKGHKPGLDALVSMARGFGVTVDFLVGETKEAHRKDELDVIIWEAAFPTIVSLLSRIGHYVQDGRAVFHGRCVFGDTYEQYADKEVDEIRRRFFRIIDHVDASPPKSDEDTNIAAPEKQVK